MELLPYNVVGCPPHHLLRFSHLALSKIHFCTYDHLGLGIFIGALQLVVLRGTGIPLPENLALTV